MGYGNSCLHACATLLERKLLRMERSLLLHLTFILGLPRFIHRSLGIYPWSRMGNLLDWYVYSGFLRQNASYSIQELSLCYFLRSSGYLWTDCRYHHVWKAFQTC